MVRGSGICGEKKACFPDMAYVGGDGKDVGTPYRRVRLPLLILQAGSMIIAMAIFMGGFAMFTAGLMEWKKGNTYGMAAYSSYGLFWFSFAALLLLLALGLAKDTGGAGAMAAYLALWGLFTLILFIGSLKMSRLLAFVLGTLALIFFLEAAGAATGTGMFTLLAGYIEIFSGFAAIYTALAPVLNDIYGTTVAPIG